MEIKLKFKGLLLRTNSASSEGGPLVILPHCFRPFSVDVRISAGGGGTYTLL